MSNAVFISDLHLHPDDINITTKFTNFINWFISQPQSSLYILGDFFHAWPGDDALDAWSIGIAQLLYACKTHGHCVYFMSGNRDFLLGDKFAKQAGWIVLTEPTVIELDGKQVLLVHGDRYCINDRAHQVLRKITRNIIFIKLFLSLSYKIRIKLVGNLRNISKKRRELTTPDMSIVTSVMLQHMNKLQTNIVIHGHIHKAGLTTYNYLNNTYQQYVLSDWDVNPTILCYNRAKGFNFFGGF